MSPALLKALGHPIRRQILRQLGSSKVQLSPSDLARELGIPLTNVAFHTRMLAEKDIIRRTEVRGRQVFSEHFYVSNIVRNELASAILGAIERDDAAFFARLAGPARSRDRA